MENHPSPRSTDLEPSQGWPDRRRPYDSPRRTVYGDIREITRTPPVKTMVNDGAVDDMGMLLKTDF